MSEQDPILALLGRIPFSFDLLNDCTLTEEQKIEKAREVMRELSARVVAAEAALARATAAYDGSTRDLLADKRRLDWLANNATYVQPGKPLTTLMFDIPEGKSLRAAIDDCAPRP